MGHSTRGKIIAPNDEKTTLHFYDGIFELKVKYKEPITPEE